MSGEEPPPANPTLDLNKVEAKEASEHMTSSGIQVAGATDPYTGQGLPQGTLSFSPAVPPAVAACAARAAGGGEGEPSGLVKAKEGLKEALGLGK